MDAAVIPLAEAVDAPPSLVGRKAANLARLLAEGFPVPPAFVLTTDAYRAFVALPAVAAAIEAAALPEDGEPGPDALESRFRRVSEAMAAAPLPDELGEALEEACERLGGRDGALAVRSSGTLEDAPDASFSGMLSSVIGARGDDELVGAVKRCWASAFRPRVASYMRGKGIGARDFEVAVLLQRLVPAERAGLVFTRDPANRYARSVVVEATYGPGDDVVSGEVTPERYVYDPGSGRVLLARRAPAGTPGPRALPEEHERRLEDSEVAELARWALRAEGILGGPQDVEWAYGEGRFWILQSRPLVFSGRDERVFPQIGEETVLLHGVGASPKVGAGEALVLRGGAVPNQVAGAVVVVDRLTNDLAVRLRDAAGVVADEGGATSHGANVLREFGVPAVISTGHATERLRDGRVVTVDGFRGLVYEGDLSLTPAQLEDVPSTATKVFASVIVPEKAAVVAPFADGVSSLRNDYFLLRSGVHPMEMIRRGRGEELEETIALGLRRTAELFSGKPVWYKTMDAPTDEFRRLAGGEREPEERNPLLGWRGIGRELAEPEMLDLELRAVARAVAEGHRDIGVKLPFVRFVREFEAGLEAVRRVGLQPAEDVHVGVSVETPAVALGLRGFLEAGAEFVSVGVSDLTMCTLALDRESHRLAGSFDPADPGVVFMLEAVATASREAGVFACATGEAARDPRLLPELVSMGYDSIGVSPAYFADVKREVHRLETVRRGRLGV
ncbi:MAG: hypothetical protein IBX62_09440 [Coriobacteriia bacterium]|nr:hypothetical protein [Coriobacteriia bacterium]